MCVGGVGGVCGCACVRACVCAGASEHVYVCVCMRARGCCTKARMSKSIRYVCTPSDACTNRFKNLNFDNALFVCPVCKKY